MNKRELQKKIDTYNNINWDSLLRTDLGRYSLDEEKFRFNNIKGYFDFIIPYVNSNRLPEDYCDQLSSQLSSLFDFVDEITSQFQNVAEKDTWLKKVRVFEVKTWENLKHIVDYIKFNYEPEEPDSNVSETIKNSLKEIEDTKKQIRESLRNVKNEKKEFENAVNKVKQDKEKYNEAIKLADSWLKTEGEVTASSFKDKAEIFNKKADDEHTRWYLWSWLVGAILFSVAALAMASVFVFRLNPENSISVGAALLRISIVGAFFYLAFLFYQQFVTQRNLYESYKFKAIALTTMEELYRAYNTDHQMRERVLNQAVRVIFVQPRLREGKFPYNHTLEELTSFSRNE